MPTALRILLDCAMKDENEDSDDDEGSGAGQVYGEASQAGFEQLMLLNANARSAMGTRRPEEPGQSRSPN